jgi:CHAT domain-containing protein
MRFLLLFFLISVSTISFCQKSAQENYEEGLRLIVLNNPSAAFSKFYSAAKSAEEGSELQLWAIYKTAHYYNYADEKTKPQVLKWTLKGLSHVRKTNRHDSLAAFIYYRSGIAYYFNYQADSSLNAYQEAIKIYEKIYGPNNFYVAECLAAMGNVSEDVLFDFSSAEPLYEKALAIRETLPRDVLNSFWISYLYSSLSTVNRKQKDFEKALAYGLRNLSFAETIPYPEYLETAYLKLAVCYRDLTKIDEAKKYFQKAILVNRRNNKGKANPLLASHFYEMGLTLEKEGQLDNAIQSYLTSLDIFKATSFLRDIVHIQTHESLGRVYLLKVDFEKAIKIFRQALALIEDYNLKKSGQASSLYKSLGDCFMLKNQFDSSLFYYQKSLIAASKGFNSMKLGQNPTINQIYQRDFCLDALLAKASIYMVLSNQNDSNVFAQNALDAFILAEKLATASRGELDLDESKWNFSENNFALYEKAISLIYSSVDLSQNQIDKCFFFMEGSKSKSLSDAINAAEIADPLMAEDSLIQFLTVQKRKIHYLRNELSQLSSSSSQIAETKKLRNALVDTDRKIQSTESRINEKYPSYLAAKYNQNIPTLSAIKEFTRSTDACVIEYFWGLDTVYGLAVAHDSTFFKKLGRSDSLINKIIEFQRFLISPGNSDQKSLDSFFRSSFDLYDIFVKPFDYLTNQTKRLIIIPDGILSQIPFEVLTTSYVSKRFDRQEYLLRSHVISYSFSASYLLKSTMKVSKENKLLAFGFTGENILRAGDVRVKANELFGTSEELESLKNKFSDGKFLSGDEVTEENFKKMAADYDLLHLAMHGQGDIHNNYSAALFFRDSSSVEDGKLNWYELLGMQMKARLAVISSCESGIGKEYRGEGMLSMANAFAFAGCRNIVMGMWKVNDQVSAYLMNEFYKNLKGGMSVDEALIEAKRSYLLGADEFMANPKLWSSLVSYGHQSVIKQNNYLLYFYGALLTLLAVVLLIKRNSWIGNYKKNPPYV